MNRFHHSKSSLFLMELVINLLLFCMLCGFGMMFFIKSTNMTEDTTALHHAVRITSSVAGLYEAGDGSFDLIHNSFPGGEMENGTLAIYIDSDFQPCTAENCAYYVLVKSLDGTISKAEIAFYDSNASLIYSIRACNHTPATYSNAKEVSGS